MLNNYKQNGHRVVFIDALRGFALIGILVSHFNHWFVLGKMPEEFSVIKFGFDSKLAELINDFFIHDKFVILFSFIFGYSFNFQALSIDKNYNNSEVVFFRRALFLFIIGLVHYLFWWGDVLFTYAILMIPLVFLKKYNNKTLLITGVLFGINLPGIVLGVINLLIHNGASAHVITNAIKSNATQLVQLLPIKTLPAIIEFNIGFIHNVAQYQFWSGALFVKLGFFCLGMVASRKGWIQQINKFEGKFFYIFVTSAVLIIALHFSLAELNTNPNNGLWLKVMSNFISFAECTLSLIMNISFVAFLYFHGTTLKLAQSFVDLGKMALTNYLLQTALGMLIFYNIGFGLYGKTTPAANFIIALIVMAFQILFSNIWFRYFNYGLVEWILRSGTFLSVKSIRKAEKNYIIKN